MSPGKLYNEVTKSEVSSLEKALLVNSISVLNDVCDLFPRGWVALLSACVGIVLEEVEPSHIGSKKLASCPLPRIHTCCHTSQIE